MFNVFISVHVNICPWRLEEGRVELELWVLVRHLMWVLATEPVSSERAARAA